MIEFIESTLNVGIFMKKSYYTSISFTNIFLIFTITTHHKIIKNRKCKANLFLLCLVE